MDNENNDIIELLDILYGMVTAAWGVPLGNDKCIIEREKAVEIINEIKSCLPSSIAEANRLVAARDEFIGNAKREAEAMRKSAEENAKAMVEEQEIVRSARALAEEILADAEFKKNALQRAASEYVNQVMGSAANQLSSALKAMEQNKENFNRQFQSVTGSAPAAAPAAAPKGTVITRIEDDDE